jgi:penicillin amidase
MNGHRLLLRLLLGRRLPITDGSISVPGINQAVTVRRDRHGIPYIEAQDDEDAWYGVGFCQGQDRAFQLEMLLRVARGTLSEIIGTGGLTIDRLSRRIGFTASARLQLEALDGQAHGVLQAFARGVTAGSSHGCRRAPHEFTLLRIRPTPYSAVDVMAVAKLQAFALASNWDIELARLHILQKDGAEALKALDPTYPDWHPVSTPPGSRAGPAPDRLSADLKALAEANGLRGGSNCWALAPSRTATGRAILANDIHLPPVLPPHWYLAHVRTPQWTAAGATYAGSPVFPAGHNEVAAWGTTAGLADNTDLFLEELGPEEHSVREGGRFIPCDVREEIIRVRGGAEVVEEVVVTPRGPIIGPALDGGTAAISIRATWLDARPMKGLLATHRASSFEEFRRAFEEWPMTSLNMLYADTSGTIGWQLVGETPRRRKGWGTVPLPGWDPDAGWEDTPIPFDDMPHVTNPPGGILATANNNPAAEGQGPFLGVDWIDGYRVARIFESLESRRDWDIAGVQALQMDQQSIPWRELRDRVLSTAAHGHDARRAIALLREWDGSVTAGSPAATVFELFVAEMTRRVAEAKAPRASSWALGKGSTPLLPRTLLVARRVGHLVRLMTEQPDGWFQSGWPRVVEEALEAAVKSVRKRYGDDEEQWAWGKLRTLEFRHPAGDRPLFRRAFNLGPIPWGGDANTVGQAAPDPADPTANPLGVASLRMVVDVGNWKEARFCLPGGQSGNPMSSHYADMLPLWISGGGVPIAWSPEDIEEAATASLRLLPTTSGPTTTRAP